VQVELTICYFLQNNLCFERRIFWKNEEYIL